MSLLHSATDDVSRLNNNGCSLMILSDSLDKSANLGNRISPGRKNFFFAQALVGLRGGGGSDGADRQSAVASSIEDFPKQRGNDTETKRSRRYAEGSAHPEYEEHPGYGLVAVPDEMITDATFKERYKRRATTWSKADDPQVLRELVRK